MLKLFVAISSRYTKYYVNLRRINTNLTVGVITKNNFKKVLIIGNYYKKLGINITVFVNARSEKNEIEKYKNNFKNVVFLENDFMYIEPIIEQASKYVETKYFCYTSNDEFLDPKILRKISKIIEIDKPESIGFSRVWVGSKNNFRNTKNWSTLKKQSFYTGSTFEMLRNRSKGMIDTQFRIFQPRLVKFESEIGGFGHKVPENMRIQVKKSFTGCCMYHLDWLYLSYNDRKEKLIKYNDFNPGIYDIEKYYFLPEDLCDINIKKLPRYNVLLNQIILDLTKTCNGI
jgi:hypothetical protein